MLGVACAYFGKASISAFLYFKGENSMKNWIKYTLLLPGIVILVLLLVMPLLSIFMPTVFPEGSFSLQSYIAFFQNALNVRIFVRTLKIALITTLICAVLGVPVAYYISRCKASLKSTLMTISMFPLLTNSVIRSFAWITILGRNGIINKMIVAMGITSEPIQMMYTEFAIVIGSVYLFLPLMITTLVGVMENIGDDMMEAAESLGANRFMAFFKVILPLSVPGIIVGSTLVFTGTLSAYTTPQLLGGNKNTVMATFIYEKAMNLGDWTGASVIAIIMIVTTVIAMKGLNYVATRLDKRGEN